jgi:hypothetical protein
LYIASSFDIGFVEVHFFYKFSMVFIHVSILDDPLPFVVVEMDEITQNIV